MFENLSYDFYTLLNNLTPAKGMGLVVFYKHFDRITFDVVFEDVGV